MHSFDNCKHSLQLPQQLIDLANKPKRAHAVSPVTVIPIQNAIVVDNANVARYSA